MAQVNTLKRVGENHPDINRYMDSLGDEIVAGHKTSRSLLLVMEKADGGTLRDLIAHARGLISVRRPRLVFLPAQFLYNVSLASLIDAVLYPETSLTAPVQHIDYHIGNVAFFRRALFLALGEDTGDQQGQTGGRGCPSPAIGVFVRSLLQHRCVLPQGFVDILEELSAPLTSLDILASARGHALAKAGSVLLPAGTGG